jgi:hypothetical protein
MATTGTSHREVGESLDARVDAASVIIPSLLFAFLTALYTVVAVQGHGTGPLVGIVMAWALLLTALRRYRVLVADGRIVKRTLFGSSEARLADLESATFHAKIVAGAKAFLPPIRLELRQRGSERPLIVNLKLLRRADVKRLFELVEQHVPIAGGHRA